MQVPQGEHKALQQFLQGLGYPYQSETENPAYQLFLGKRE
jgi:threonine dehydratase